jgi:DNA-binding response OmpR family regulator
VHAADQAAVKTRLRPARDRVRLMVVEPDELLRTVLAHLLRRAGYAVSVAATAEEVLLATRESGIDCLVTELDLPDASGLDLYARLLFQGRPRLPAVFMSVWPSTTLELGLRSAPWVRLLRKPCAFDHLLAALERCLGAPRNL